MTTARDVIHKATTELEWQRVCVNWARHYGWKATGMWDSRTLWWGTDSGFPDLLLVRGSRIVCIECKTMRGKVAPEQQDWLLALAGAGVETFVFRPSDEDAMRKVLE